MEKFEVSYALQWGFVEGVFMYNSLIFNWL